MLGARDVGTPLRCPSSEASALVAQAKGLSLGPSAHTQVFGVYFALVEPIGVRRFTSKVSKRVGRKKKKKSNWVWKVFVESARNFCRPALFAESSILGNVSKFCI